jgi:uncharacterized protein affecting Mg2+/Co2+ transport
MGTPLVEGKRMLFAYCIKMFHDNERYINFFYRKWFVINDKGAYKRMITNTEVVE